MNRSEIEAEVLSALRRYPQLTVYAMFCEIAATYDVSEFEVRSVMQNLALSGRVTSDDSSQHVNSLWRLVT